MRHTIETEARTKSDFWFACVDIDVLRDPSLSPSDKVVYGVICSHADVRTRIATLAVATIANEASCGERTTQNCIKKLTERGILEREARFINGRQVSNLYRIVGHDATCYKEKGNDYSQNIQPENANLPKSAVSCAPEGATCCTPEGAATAHKLEPQDNENQKNNPFPPTPQRGTKERGKGDELKGDKNCYDTTNRANTTPKAPPALLEGITDAYRHILSELPPLENVRRAHVREIEARIREDPARKELSWWEAFFKRVRDFPCPMGLTSSGWSADFRWLIGKKGVQKILGGSFLSTSGIGAKFGTKGGTESGWEIQKQYTSEGGVVDARALLLRG